MQYSYADIDIDYLLALTIGAGDEILKIYNQDFDVEYKDDLSPLTAADRIANEIIVSGIENKYPQSKIISEESKHIPYDDRKRWTQFWLIDPLDGTKEFIKRNGEFTINIALIEHGVPTLGIVYAPVLSLMYYGAKNLGTYCIREGVKHRLEPTKSYLEKDPIKIVASRSHLNIATIDFIEYIEAKGKKTELIQTGSSLKFCLVADGSADVYPRFAPTSEWDTAAGHAIVNYMGKQVIAIDTGLPLVYNKPSLLNTGFIVG